MIPTNITKQHLLQAIKEIDTNGITPGRHSSTYDVEYNGKKYPPKLIISLANKYANGKELDSEVFAGGEKTPAFKLLRQEGFNILKKENFTWVSTHQQIVKYLSTKENAQQELIDLLQSVGISPFNDQSVPGQSDSQLNEIDPFTFFCYIHKYGDNKRLKLLKEIAQKLEIEIPTHVKGIPTAQAQKVWLFPYKYKRKNNEVSRLWNFFKKELIEGVTEEDFTNILEIRNVGHAKLTEALFYIKPEKYFPINRPTKPYLKQKLGIEPNFNTYAEYIELLGNIKQKIEIPFYELSYEAWKWNKQRKKENYWIFQANPNMFDYETALREDILTSWTVAVHKDKITKGDKVILWITGKQAGCYALAEITSEPRQKSIEKDYHLWKTEDKNNTKAEIKITHNLIDTPITKDEIAVIDELKNLKVGVQGTNFSSSKEEYEVILSLIEEESDFSKIRDKFSKKDFNNYISILHRAITDLNLQPNDQRVVFSLRNKRLNFIIGQRYCLNLFYSNSKGKYGIVSKTKLNESSEPYAGKSPQPFYSYFNNF